MVSTWEEDWKDIVAVHTDMTTAEKMGDQSKNPPLQVLESAHNIFISASVVDSLPVFNKPGPITSIADSLAKAAKVGGGPMVIRTVQNTSLKNNKSRSLAAAFLMAADSSEMPVKLSKEEKDFADYLVPFARNVINASPEKYRDSMNTLLTASSSGEKV